MPGRISRHQPHYAGSSSPWQAVALNTGSLTLTAGSLNLALGKRLTSSGAVLLDGTANVAGTVSPATVGRYTLLNGVSVGGTVAQGVVRDRIEVRSFLRAL